MYIAGYSETISLYPVSKTKIISNITQSGSVYPLPLYVLFHLSNAKGKLLRSTFVGRPLYIVYPMSSNRCGIKGNRSRGHILNSVIMILGQNVCVSRPELNMGH